MDEAKSPESPLNREFAFYYPNPMWADSNLIKSLLLFFDGIALLVPEYMTDRPRRIDPAIAGTLEDEGLLRLILPEKVVDVSAAQQLGTIMVDLLGSGALDRLAGDGSTAFAEISWSRLGGGADWRIADEIVELLKDKGLASESEDGLSVPIHPAARSLVLTLLSQILRGSMRREGIELWPTTDRPRLVKALHELLGSPVLASSASVVTADIRQIGLDVSAVPIDELLAYRRQEAAAWRRYMRDVRSFVRVIGHLPGNERERAAADRNDELKELLSDVHKRTPRAWLRPGGIAIGASGAAWQAVSGDPLGALLAALGLGLATAADARDTPPLGAFSYLIQTGARWPET